MVRARSQLSKVSYASTLPLLVVNVLNFSISLDLISQFKAEREARALAEGLTPSNASNDSNNNMTNSVPAPVVEPAPVPNKRRYALFLRILICCLLLKCFVRVAVSRCYYQNDLDSECLFLFINFD